MTEIIINQEEDSKEEFALIPITEDKFASVFIKNGLQIFIDYIKKDAEGFIADVSTEKGRKEAAAKTGFIKRKKAQIEKAGKQYIKELKEKIKPASEELKRAVQELNEWRDEVGKPLTEWREKKKKKKEKEERRIAGIKEKIEKIINYRLLSENGNPLHLTECSSEIIKKAVEKLIDYELNEEIFEEFFSEAEKAKSDKLEELKSALKNAEEKEKLAFEQKKLIEEKEKLALEQKKLIEKKETVEKEHLKSIEETVALKEKIQEELKEGYPLAVKAEKETVIKKTSAETDADKEHQREINRIVIGLFMKNGFSKKESIKILKIIIKAEIPQITVNY